MIPDSVDILIAGGGPAGLSAAESAARAGCRVLVAEQNHEIGSPTRTSGGSFASELRALGIPADLYHVVSRCRFLSPNNQAIIDYDSPNLCVMDVRRVFQHLAERAIDAGAALSTATRVIAPLTDGNTTVGATLKVRSREHSIRSRILMDATGYRAHLAKGAGIHEGFQRFGVGAEYDLYAPHYDEREAVLIVGGQVAPSGYAWFLPYGHHRVRAGVGVIHKDSTDDPHDFLDALLAEAPALHVNLTKAQPVEYHYGLIPSDGVARHFAGDGILALGDAAGHASCLVGEGIRWAIKAGRMAGEVAAGCIRKGETSSTALSDFETQWNSQHGRNLRIAHQINRRIARWSDTHWDERIELLKLLTPTQFDEALQSSFGGTWLAKVLWSRPELVRHGVDLLLKNSAEYIQGRLGTG